MATITKAANSNSVVSSPGWTTPTNAYADDGTVAAFSGANGVTWSNDFGFPAFSTSDIPDGSTINSVTVYANVWQSSSSRGTCGLYAVDNGATVGTEVTSTSTSTSNVISKVVAGATLTDLRTAGIIEARVRCTRSASQAFTGSLDYVYVTVDYTPPTQTVTVGLVDGSAAIYAPSVVYVLTPPLINGSATVYAPTVIPDQFVTLPLVVAGAAASYPDVVLADSPVGYWRLGESIGTGTADNLGTAGSALDGTYVGPPTLEVAGALTGDNDTAITIVANQYVDIPDHDGLSIATNGVLSIEWLDINAGGSAWCFLSKGSTSAREWLIYRDTGYNYLLNALTGETATTGTPISKSNNVWHHNVVTIDQPNHTVVWYIDGSVQTGYPKTDAWAYNTGNGTGHMFIGRFADTDWWAGTVDEVAVYGSLLTAEQVAAHYAAISGGGGGTGAVAFAPDLEQEAPSGPQTVTVGLVDGSAAIYTPTLTPKNTLTVALVDAGAAIYQPTLTPKNTLTVGLVDAGAAIYQPTVKGINLVTLGLVDAGAAIYAPTTMPDQFLVLGLVDAAAAIYAPVLVYVLVPPLVDAGATVYAPQVQPDQFLTIPLVDGAAAIYAPTVAIAGGATQSITLPAVSTGIFDPDLFDPGIFDTGPFAFPPTVANVAGAQTVTLPLADGGATIYAPAIGFTVTLPLVDAGATIYAPSVQPDQYVTVGLVDGGAAIFELTVIPGPLSVTVALVDGGATVFAPTLLPQPVTVTLGLVTSTAAIYAPSLVYVLVPPLVDAGATAYAPTVKGVNLLTVGLVDGAAAIFDLTVSQPANVQVLTVPLVDSGVALYDPTLTWYSTLVMPLVDGTGEAYAPTLANALATLTGRTLNRLNGRPLPNCTVLIFRSSDNVLHVETTSNSQGVYSVAVVPGVEYWAVAWSGIKVQGVTDRDLVGS